MSLLLFGNVGTAPTPPAGIAIIYLRGVDDRVISVHGTYTTIIYKKATYQTIIVKRGIYTP